MMGEMRESDCDLSASGKAQAKGDQRCLLSGPWRLHHPVLSPSTSEVLPRLW